MLIAEVYDIIVIQGSDNMLYSYKELLETEKSKYNIEKNKKRKNYLKLEMVFIQQKK